MSNIHYSHRNGMIPILLICAVTLCLFFSDAGYSQPATNKDDPGRNDNATGQLSTPIYTDFPDTELGRQLSDHINYLAGVGKDAEGKYQESLKQLRQRAPQAVKVLAETYPRIRADRYFRRWAIVETMREMNNNSALNPLYRIALSPISTEHWRDPERFSIDKEINIRVTAVEGMSDLAMQGNKEAEQLLLRLITNKELGIRRQAIRGYLGVGQDRDRRARLLRSRLPKSDYGLIKLESTDVKRVPHPDDVPDNLKPRYKQKDDDPPRAVLSTSSFRNADTLSGSSFDRQKSLSVLL